jgi:hypothetical protein
VDDIAVVEPDDRPEEDEPEGQAYQADNDQDEEKFSEQDQQWVAAQGATAGEDRCGAEFSGKDQQSQAPVALDGDGFPPTGSE